MSEMQPVKARALIISGFRIFFGVAVGIIALLLLAFLLGLLVKAFPRFSLFLLGCIICGFGIRSIFVCLRYGWAGGGKGTV
jgi:flagellar biosynthesis protein FliR